MSRQDGVVGEDGMPWFARPRAQSESGTESSRRSCKSDARRDEEIASELDELVEEVGSEPRCSPMAQ